LLLGRAFGRKGLHAKKRRLLQVLTRLAGGVVVATDVVGTVPVMGVCSFFELEQPATTAALRARTAMNTLIPREVMV
jgi:hypothetical protein